MIGLPEAGKTTFVAACWNVAFGKKSEYVLNSMSDTTYINEISSKWMSCEKLGRTNPSAGSNIEIELKKTTTGEVVTLLIPDLSGETFENHFNDRFWDAEYGELATDLSGILLFVHPDRIISPYLINEVVDLDKDTEAETGDTEAETGDTDKPKTIVWSSKYSPTQVQLVDIIQFHIGHSTRFPMNISVIISAWDCIRGPEIEPSAWLEREIPLLYQYLVSNDDLIQFKVFGVSAQGGDIEDDDSKRRLLNITDAIERVSVTDGASRSNNLISPISWLLEKNND
jgi:hypothetical protein